MEIITRRQQELQSVRDHHVQLQAELPMLKEMLVLGQAAYDKLIDATEYEQELRDKRLPSLKPIPDIEEEIAKFAIHLQWIRRLIQDIKSV